MQADHDTHTMLMQVTVLLLALHNLSAKREKGEPVVLGAHMHFSSFHTEAKQNIMCPSVTCTCNLVKSTMR